MLGIILNSISCYKRLDRHPFKKVKFNSRNWLPNHLYRTDELLCNEIDLIICSKMTRDNILLNSSLSVFSFSFFPLSGLGWLVACLPSFYRTFCICLLALLGKRQSRKDMFPHAIHRTRVQTSSDQISSITSP